MNSDGARECVVIDVWFESSAVVDTLTMAVGGRDGILWSGFV